MRALHPFVQGKFMVRESVSVVVFNKERDSVLLIQRRDVPVWALPGGGVDAGENPENAACREALEETGCRIRIVRKVAEYLPVNWMTRFTHFYEGEILTGEIQSGEETLDAAFFPLDALPLMPPPFASWIADALKEAPLMRKKIEGVNYWVLLKLFIQHPIFVFRYLLTKCGFHINSKKK